MRKAINLLTLLTLVGLLLIQIGCSSDEEDSVTPPPACSIVLDQFNDWEYYLTGETINIRWTQTTGGNVKIELYKGVSEVGVITAQTANTGFYPWLNSTTFGAGSGEDYSIKVTNLSDSACNDQTNTFELIDVSNCYIKFPWTVKDSIPDQKAGNILDITWDSANTTGNVNLELWYEPFTARGEKVGDIAENLANTGSYAWTVDTFNRGTDQGYRLKINDVDLDSCKDTSVRFNIEDEDNCVLDVEGVNGGTTYNQGDNIPLTFTMENSSGVVKLTLFSGGNQVDALPMKGVIIERFDTQNGTAVFNWTVSDLNHTGPAFNRFSIRATDVDDEYCHGNSSEFGIAQ